MIDEFIGAVVGALVPILAFLAVWNVFRSMTKG